MKEFHGHHFADTFQFHKFGHFSIFITWALWKRLLYPESHPLFRRLHKISSDNGDVRIYASWLFRLLLIACPVACCGLWLLLIQIKAPIVGPLFIAIVFLSGNVYVSLWIIEISVTIAREHEKGTYDQLCVAPAGVLGVNQVICAASLHRNDGLTWINIIRKLVAGLSLFVFLMILMASAFSQGVFNMVQLLRPLLEITMLVAATYIDHIQAVVMGCLVAMLVPVYSQSSKAVPIMAVAVFLTLQAIIFLVSIFLVASLLTLRQELPASSWGIEILLPVVSLVLFYLIRETFNVFLWRTLAYQLNVSPMELSVPS